jgi:hypothetical protein
MGYYTQYSLNIELDADSNAVSELDATIEKLQKSNMSKDDVNKIIEKLKSSQEYKRSMIASVEDVISILDYNPFSDRCKWYSHDEDMIAISKQYPSCVFTLQGIGEEYPDMWRKYYFQGKVQTTGVRLAYDTFDKSKLV